MLRPTLPKYLRRFRELGALFLVLVIVAAFLIFYRGHHARDFDHDGTATLPVSVNLIQIPSEVANSTEPLALPPATDNLVVRDTLNRAMPQLTSREAMDVRFAGNQRIPTTRLEELAWSVKSVKPGDFSKELSSSIKTLYRALGFLKADVIVEADPNAPGEILIKLDEGEQYRWGDFKVNSEILEQKTVLSLFHVEKGWPANPLDIPNMFFAYINSLKEEGHMDCSYTPHIIIDDESAQINLQMDISEGPRYIVHNVSLDNPKAQAIIAQMQGNFFSPSLYQSLLDQAGLTEKEARLDFNSTRGEVSISGLTTKP